MIWTQKANASYLRKKKTTCIHTRHGVRLQTSRFPATREGETWRRKACVLIGCGADLKFKAYSCEWESERSTDWIRRFEQTIGSCAVTGRFTKAKVFTLRHYSAVYLLRSPAIVYSPYIHVINTEKRVLCQQHMCVKICIFTLNMPLDLRIKG